MASDTSERTGEYRLVMWNDFARARAGLYDKDAGRAATPLVEFRLDPLQELPRQVPGAAVRVEGTTAPRSRFRVRSHDGIEIVPRGRVTKGGERTIAELGHLLVHPDSIGFDHAWGYALGSRRDAPQVLKEWKIRRGAATVQLAIGAFEAALFAWLAFVVVFEDVVWWARLLTFAVALRIGWVATVMLSRFYAELRLTWPRVRALRRARRGRSTTEGSVPASFRWCVGSDGPILVVTIPGDGGGKYEVVGVPDGFDPTEQMPAKVARTARGRLPVSIAVGGAVLTPVARLV